MIQFAVRKLRGGGQARRQASAQRVRLWLSAWLALVAAACVTTSQVPKVTHWAPLVAELGERGPAVAPRLSVVHAAPMGPAAATAIISVVFSQPMRSLEGNAADVPPPIRLMPAVPGSWQWVGTNAVQFRSVAPELPVATEFEVVVSGALTSLRGQALGADYTFRFTTPRPAPVTFDPHAGSDEAAPEGPIAVEFNQVVALAEVERLGELTVNGRALRFKATSDSRSNRGMFLRPSERMPLGAAVTFRLQPGVRGEGPLLSEAPFDLAFRVRSGPGVKLGCGWSECVPGAALWVETATPMRAGDLRKHLRVTPAMPLEWSTWFDDDEFVTSLQSSASLLPRATYRLEVTPGFADRYGQRLTAPTSYSFQTGDYPPSLAIGAEGEILRTSALRPLPIRTRNLPRYQLTTGPVSPSFVAEYYDRPWDPFEVTALPGVTSRWIERGAANKVVTQRIDLLEVLGRANAAGPPRGAVLVDARYKDASGEEQRRTHVLQVTDLGLTAKLSRAGSLVWVTSLSGGAPIPGAGVELWRGGQRLHQYTADGDGLVQVPASDFTPQFDGARDVSTALVARHASDWTARSERSIIGPWSMPVTPDLGPEQPLTLFMFTERGIYRPGDQLWLKGIARRPDEVGGGQTLVRGKFTLALHSPNAEEVSRQVVEAGEFGTFAAQFTVPTSAELGSWSISVEDDGAAKGATETLAPASFDVAEYQPAEFKVQAGFDREQYLPGATAQLTAGADYLFGAPVAGADVNFTLSYESAAFAPPGSTGFTCGDYAYRADLDSAAPSSGLLAQGSAKLDAKGQLTIANKLQVPAQDEPKRVRFEAEVSDASHQAIAGSALTLLHPAEFYLGLRDLQDWFVTAPGSVKPSVLAFTPEGTHLAGKRVTVELIRRRWTSVQEEWEGGYRDVGQRVDEPVGRCALTTRQAPTECALQVVEGGYYVLRASSVDPRGNRVQASQSFYAIGSGRTSWRSDASNATVELVANKLEYEVGETAKVLIKSPFEKAEALITIERGGILEHRRATLTGATPTIEVPITERFRPNAYVSVHLLGVVGAQTSRTTRGSDLYRVGTTELRLNAQARKLSVELQPQRVDYMPGQTVEADVIVKDAAGRPARAELSVYAVDEGVLMLTGYQVPDPVAAFTASRPLRVATLESREDLARIIDAPSLLGSDKGSEGGGGGDVRRQFRQSAYFNPALLTDAQGRAHFSFKLPDNLTTYRLMAVAVTADDRYGSGQSEVRVSKPLMARPALPRFVRAGDSFAASVVVSTKASSERTVRVSLEATGLSVVGPREQVVPVPADGTTEVTFQVKAERAGAASLTFDVRGSREHDAVTLKRTVQSPARLEAVAAYGETSDVEGQRLGTLAEVRGDQGGLEVSVASTRLVGLDASMEQLVEYPYACTEQLASRLLPLLPLEELAKAFGFTPPSGGRQVAERSVRQLLLRQRGDGGFGFWPEAPQSHPWLSAYTLWALWLAKEHEVAVEPSVFLRGTKYLRADLLHVPEVTAEGREEPRPPELDAFAVWVLAQLGKSELANIERLFERRSEMSLDGVAWLSMAAELLKAPEAIRAPLLATLNASIALDGNRARVTDPKQRSFHWTLASPLRTQALVLRALLTSDPKHVLAGKLATELLAQREAGTWRTTQESAFALLALNDYWRAQEAAVPAFVANVWVGNDRVLKQPFRGRNTAAVVQQVPMTRLQQAGGLDVVFQREAVDLKPAQGTLFYEARLSYAPVALPTTPLDRGFSIDKTLRAATSADLAQLLKGMGPDVSRVPVGQLAVVDLVVVTPVARRFVVIDDPLPAGFEAFDSSLLTSSAHTRELEGATTVTGFSEAWYRRELRDDRALFFVDEMEPGMYHYRYLARTTTRGRFVVPATRALEMYQPEVYGRTATRFVEVFDASQAIAQAPSGAP